MEGGVTRVGSRLQSQGGKGRGTQRRKMESGEQGEMNAERERCLFQKRNQEKLYLVGICRRPLLSLWRVCVYKCVGRAAVVTAARELSLVSSLKPSTRFNSAFYFTVV